MSNCIETSKNKVNPKDFNTEACLDMFGQHIKLCIEDYGYCHRHIDRLNKIVRKYNGTPNRVKHKLRDSRVNRIKNSVINYESAKSYLFGKGLAYDIERLELPLSLDYIRAQAKRLASGRAFNESFSV